jgi:hypothetical protein
MNFKKFSLDDPETFKSIAGLILLINILVLAFLKIYNLTVNVQKDISGKGFVYGSSFVLFIIGFAYLRIKFRKSKYNLLILLGACLLMLVGLYIAIYFKINY